MSTFYESQKYSKLNAAITYIMSVTPMLDDTGTTPTEYGILTGPAYLATYAILSVPGGFLIDRIKYPKWVVMVCLSLISFINALNGLCTAYWQLVVIRVGYSLLSIGADPAFAKLISLYFDPDHRGRAFGWFLINVYFGSAFASLTLLLAEYCG